MLIRKAKLDDCLAVAQLHARCLTESFLGTLGHGFLTALYQALIQYSGGTVIVAEEKNEIIGFVSGVDEIKKFYNFFIKNKWPAIIYTLLPKAFSTKIIKKILETRHYSDKKFSITVPETELLSIAVTEEFRGQGVSAELFKQLAEEFKKKGKNKFKIIVGNNLIGAKKFYQKMGCEKISQTEIHQDLPSDILIYKI